MAAHITQHDTRSILSSTRKFTASEMRAKFDAKLLEKVIREQKSDRSDVLTKERYQQIVNEVKEGKRLRMERQSLTSKLYRRLKRFDIIDMGQGDVKLIENSHGNTGDVRFYCHTEELFDILKMVHEDSGHKRTRVMESELKKKYCNINRKEIDIYLSLCDKCQLKKMSPRKGLVVPKSITTSRCQVDVIDMLHTLGLDNDYRFVLYFEDCHTKFSILRPLKTQTTEEIADQLVDIFCIVGVPCILQSNNGKEFAQRIINSIVVMWTTKVKLVCGKCQLILHSQDNEQYENISEDIVNMLKVWMDMNRTNKWSKGLRFVQSERNRTFHPDIQRTPAEALFGVPQKNGLRDWCTLPEEMNNDLETEEDLEKIITYFGVDDNESRCGTKVNRIHNEESKNEENLESNNLSDKNEENFVGSSVLSNEKEENYNQATGEEYSEKFEEDQTTVAVKCEPNFVEVKSENMEYEISSCGSVEGDMTIPCKSEIDDIEYSECSDNSNVTTLESHISHITVLGGSSKEDPSTSNVVVRTDHTKGESLDPNFQDVDEDQVELYSGWKKIETEREVILGLTDKNSQNIFQSNVENILTELPRVKSKRLRGDNSNTKGNYDDDSGRYLKQSKSKDQINCRLNDSSVNNKLTVGVEKSCNIQNDPVTESVSLVSNQWSVRCHCTRYCIDKKCKCRFNSMKCNSKCHKNGPCKNK